MNLTKLQTKSLNKFKDLVEEIKENESKTDDNPIGLIQQIEEELGKLMDHFMIGAKITCKKDKQELKGVDHLENSIEITIVKDLFRHKGHYPTGDK